MGTQYSQLSIEERCELARLHTAGHSYRQIAAALDRAPSTIMREVKRNGSRKRGYEPVYADEQAWARRWVGGKLERDAALRKTVLGYLRQCWSPEQVAGHMARDAGGPVILPRDHLSFHIRTGGAHQGLQLAAVPAARQGATATPSAQWAQSGLLHCQAPSTGGTSPGGSRPPNARPLGG